MWSRWEQPILFTSLRQAQFLRALVLASQPPLSHAWRVNESDVVTALFDIIARLGVAALPQPPALPFRGDQHVFMSADHLLEPGFLRPASLPKDLGPLHFADPSISAYTDVTRWGSPLQAANMRRLLTHHPLRAFLSNSIAVGFPLLSEPPRRFRRERPDARLPLADPRLEAQVDTEIAHGAFLDASGWPHNIPLRSAPYFGVEKDGKMRGVCDLTFSTPSQPSANDMTRRPPLPPARLASWPTVAQRILFLRRHAPGRAISLAKLDVTRAFRQCPLPQRDFWKAYHFLRGCRYVHTRLPFGATCSVDLMAPGVAVVQDLAMSRFGIFCQTYVDDLLIIDYSDAIDAAVSKVRALWHFIGWPLSAAKFEAEGRPATAMVFLGVHIDTTTCTASVAPKRMLKLQALLSSWLDGSVTPTIKRLRALAGTLNFVAAVIPFGRVFLRRLYQPDALLAPGGMTPELREDIHWWNLALVAFNGKASFLPPSSVTDVMHIATDAAKSGWAVVSPFTRDFASGLWTADELANSTVAMWEALTILFGAILKGPSVQGGFLVSHTDSAASEATLSRMAPHNLQMYHILRCVVLVQLTFRFRLVPRHLAGVLNGLADHGSRHNQLPKDYFHYRRLRLPLELRQLGGALLSQPRTPPNLAAWSTQLQLLTSTPTAATLATPSHPTLPWTIWSPLLLVNPDMAVFSTTPSGSVSTNRA